MIRQPVGTLDSAKTNGLLLLQCGRDPKAVLTRLWQHENMRVFQDRLVDTADREYLQRLLHGLLKSRFDTRLSYEVTAGCCTQSDCCCEGPTVPEDTFSDVTQLWKCEEKKYFV